MAYDPKDPADKKIVEDLIKAALAEQAEEHEQNVSGLKDKNKELLKKLKDAEKGENNAAEVARLEEALEKNQGELKQAQKDLKAANKTIETHAETIKSETAVNRQLLVDNGLTEHLTKVKVPAELQPAVKAYLSTKVELKDVDGKRVAQVGDKSLGDYITEWSQGDEGKHYIAAPGNAGAGGQGNKVPGGNGKTIKRADYEANPGAYASQFAEGATLVD